MKNACKNCKYADFERTPSGNIRRGKAGRCRYVVVWPPLPLSITTAYGYCEPEKTRVLSTDTDCPVFEPKELSE